MIRTKTLRGETENKEGFTTQIYRRVADRHTKWFSVNFHWMIPPTEEVIDVSARQHLLTLLDQCVDISGVTHCTPAFPQCTGRSDVLWPVSQSPKNLKVSKSLMYKHRLLTKHTLESLCLYAHDGWLVGCNFNTKLHGNMHMSHFLTMQKHDSTGVWWHS